MGDKIPENVYLRVRNCDAWFGSYSRQNCCIHNVGRMMDFYGVKPYYLILLRYKGFGRFSIEIFNHMNIEIDYPLRPICKINMESQEVIVQMNKYITILLMLRKWLLHFTIMLLGNQITVLAL